MPAFAPAPHGEASPANTVEGVISNFAGVSMIGSNGAFYAQLVTNARVLNVTGESSIGNSATSRDNVAVVASSTWSNNSSLTIGC